MPSWTSSYPDASDRTSPRSRLARPRGGLAAAPEYEATHAIGSTLGILVLPDAYHGPALCTELLVGSSIATPVRRELLDPPGSIRLGSRAMTRARVPETAVDVDGDALAGEDDVDALPPVGQNGPIDMVAQAGPVERSTEGELGRSVAPAGRTHASSHARIGRARRVRATALYRVSARVRHPWLPTPRRSAWRSIRNARVDRIGRSCS